MNYAEMAEHYRDIARDFECDARAIHKTDPEKARAHRAQARHLRENARALDCHASGKPPVGSKPNRHRGGKSTPPRPF